MLTPTRQLRQDLRLETTTALASGRTAPGEIPSPRSYFIVRSIENVGVCVRLTQLGQRPRPEIERLSVEALVVAEAEVDAGLEPGARAVVRGSPMRRCRHIPSFVSAMHLQRPAFRASTS